MNVEKGIHTLWAATAALEALLPVARVFTGRVPAQPQQPYATILSPLSPTFQRTDKGMIREVQIRIQVWPLDFATGRAIQNAIDDGFSNTAFDLDAGRVVDLQHDDSSSLQEVESDDASWQFISTFTAVAHKARTN